MQLPNKNDALHKAWLYRTLSAIAGDTFLASVLCFKGGTCAAMRGLLDRFSVDLDFDYIGNVQDMDKARKKLELIFKKLDLKISDNNNKTLQYFLKYESKLGRANLKIVTFFPPLKGNQYEFVKFHEINRVIQCQTIETMFSNKLIALIDRYKSKQAIAEYQKIRKVLKQECLMFIENV